ncbi:MAG TPA: phosphotransferase [Burkholderiaceae bacterium]|nr:phosphotransferase [Burkholderiaceae bacterium]
MTAPLPPAAGPERPSLPGVPPAPTPAAPVAWADPARAEAFARWIAAIAPAQGLRPDTVRLASADASFRRYLRVDTATPGLARIVMDAPPDKEDSRPFVKVAALMREAGVTAPEVLAWDEPQGFMLLDDLGRQTMLDRIDREHAEANRPRYEQAIDALIRWQLASRPGVLPPYDAALLQRELQLFPDWYLAKHRGVAVEGKLNETLDKTFALIVQENLRAAPVYVHRDFMPRNLMVRGDSETSLGVLDFQDAVYGPITYDIASLMRDAFLSWDEDFVIDITVRYWQAARKAGLPVDEDFGDFYRAVEWMGLQRHLKVAGIFARLTLRDGKPKYLADTPRFIGYIRATASRYRELTPLLRLVDQVEGTEAATGYAFGRM